MNKIGSIVTAAALAAYLASAAPAAPKRPRGEARLAQLIEGRVPGKPVDCIEMRSISSTEIVDGTAIVYKAGSRLYVNRPESGASSLHRDDVLLTRNYNTRLCSIDIVHLLAQGSNIDRGFVGLGKFIPYEKPARG